MFGMNLPGLLVRSALWDCFHSDTIMTLSDGSKCPMKDLPFDCDLLWFYNTGSDIAPTVAQSIMKISKESSIRLKMSVQKLIFFNVNVRYVLI